MKTHWTKNEEKCLKANYGSMSIDTLAEMLGRTKSSIKKKAARMDLVKKITRLTKYQIQEIIDLYPQLGPIALSKRMHLDRDIVYNKAHRLGLKMLPKDKGKISSKANTGRKMTEHTKKMIRKANRKYNSPNRCVDCGNEIQRRAKRCQPCELKSRAGEGHNWWKGGISSLNNLVSKILYPVWKYPIMCRDGFTCQYCQSSMNLEVHHLVPYTEIRDKVLKEYPDLKISIYEQRKKLAKLIVAEHEIESGVTLCRSCHESCHFEQPGELLGRPNVEDEGNQQPSLPKVISIVGRKVQRTVGEDIAANNPTTSARIINSNDDIICAGLHGDMQK